MGKSKKKKSKLPLQNNFKFAVYSLAKVCKVNIDFGTFKDYEDFKNAIKLRDRITHPKDVEDLSISSEEMKIFEKGMRFFSRKH